jgi:hypothetical protein
MTRMLIRLYPAAWRQRYGDELEELMGDAPGGWRASFDVFKGAITMRMKNGSTAWLALWLMAAGAVLGFAGSYLIPVTWEARTVAEISGPGGSRALVESLQKSQSNTTSRRSLANLMIDPHLDIYKTERQSRPLEDIEDTMRRNIHIGISPNNGKGGSDLFSLSFRYSDPSKAADTASALMARMIQELEPGYSITVLDAPTVPQKPIAPQRLAVMVSGILVGLIVAFIIFIARRRPNPPGPGLQPA